MKITFSILIFPLLLHFLSFDNARFSLFAEPVGTRLADDYYSKNMYDLAQIEYDRAMHRSPSAQLANKKSLTEIRRREYKEALRTVHPYRMVYGSALIHMYSALRQGTNSIAIDDYYQFGKMANLTPGQIGRADLLMGTLHIENRDFDSAVDHYTKIFRNNEDPKIRRTAAGVLNSIEKRKEAGYKSPLLAGFMSALLPGSGQIYASHEADGIVAFLFNATLLGSAAALYNHEHARNMGHGGSAVLGSVGLFFYAANIAGGAASAKRYNIYQDRMFHRKIRDSFFNVEFIEDGANVRFQFTLK